MGEPRKPPRRTGAEPDTDLVPLQRARPQSSPPPPPPPRPRRNSALPPPPPPGATQARPPRPQPSQQTPDIDAWRHEIEVLQRDAEALREQDPARAALLYGVIAQVAASVLGDAPTGASALQAASELSRDRWIAMFSRREAIGARQWPRALDLMRAELPQVGDPRERVSLLFEIAVVEELVKGDRAAARQALEEAREIDPAHTGVLQALGEIYYAGGEWERLVNVLQSMADATLDVVNRSMLRHALGLIHDVQLKAPAAARAAYKLALAGDPTNLAAAISLQSLALAQEDWSELARALASEAELVGEPRAVRRLLERAGDLYWERLGDAEAAIDAYRKAAASTPDEVAPLRKLSAVLESIGRWRELVDVYQQELPLLRDPEERGDLYFRIGEVCEGHLGRAEDAIAAWQAALEAVPTHLPTLQALGALYRANDRWSDIVQMDLHEAEKISDPKRRAERYFDVAEIVERRIADDKEAVRLYQRALDLDPGQRGAFTALERLYRREERWSELIRLYELQANVTRDPALTRYYKQEIGRLWRERMRNPEKAAAALRDALALDAPDLSPLLQLAAVLQSSKRWEQLVAALEQLAERLGDEADVVGVLHRLARVLEIELQQDDRALAVHERVLARQPGDEVSLRALGRLHHRAGRWAEVIGCYGRQLQHCQSAEERAAIYYRMGRIYERKLGKRDDAVAAFDVALGECPRYAPAFRALDRILRRDHLWPRLLEVLERHAQAERTSIGKAQALHAMGAIHELHLRDLVAAERCYAAAVAAVPTYEAAVAALSHVSEARGEWKTLDQQYCGLLERTEEPNARVSVLMRLGMLCELRLSDPGRAALFYQSAIDTAPLGRALMFAELRATRVDAGPGQTVRALSRLGARANDTRLQHGYRLLAALRDEVSAQGPSPTLFLETASLGRSDPGVTDGVIRCLSREIVVEAPTQALPDALAERAQSCASAQARALLLLEAAFLYERLGLMRDAALAYEDAGRAVADLLPMLRGIRRIAVTTEQWPAVVGFLAREAEVAAHPDNRAAALLAAGEAAVSRLNDVRGALTHYKRLLELQPDHERGYLRATALLERLADYQGLFDLIAARAAATKDPEARAVLLRRQAELQRDHLDDPRGAVATLKQAIANNPQDIEGFMALGPLLEEQRWWQDAADCWRQIAELTAGTETSRSARLREAEIRERELGDREAARGILEELIVDPDDREAARYMAELCERMGHWGRAKELYEQLAQTTRDAVERAGYLVSLSGVIAVGLGDETGAARALDEAFVLALSDVGVVQRLEDRYARLGDWCGYVAAAERALGQARVVATPQVALRLSVARAYAEELGRPDLAARHLESAMELSPADPTPAARLGRTLLDGGRTELALPQYRRALAADPFHVDALRGLGAALVREGFPDAAHLLGEVADFLETGRPPEQPLGPRGARRPVSFEELQVLMPRAHTPAGWAITEIARLLEPYAPALLVEATGRIPRGDELPEANAVALRCRAIAQVLSVEPLRVFVDPAPAEGPEARLVADARLALGIGKELTRSAGQSLLVFEVARPVWFVAQRASFGAFAGPSELAAILQAIVTEEGNDHVRELRRRVLKPLPRRVRKDAERFALEKVQDLSRDVAAWYAEEHRWADRLGLLLSRDPVAVLQAAAGGAGAEVRASARAAELVRWLATDQCWRIYLRVLG